MTVQRAIEIIQNEYSDSAVSTSTRPEFRNIIYIDKIKQWEENHERVMYGVISTGSSATLHDEIDDFFVFLKIRNILYKRAMDKHEVNLTIRLPITLGMRFEGERIIYS